MAAPTQAHVHVLFFTEHSCKAQFACKNLFCTNVQWIICSKLSIEHWCKTNFYNNVIIKIMHNYKRTINMIHS